MVKYGTLTQSALTLHNASLINEFANMVDLGLISVANVICFSVGLVLHFIHSFNHPKIV